LVAAAPFGGRTQREHVVLRTRRGEGDHLIGLDIGATSVEEIALAILSAQPVVGTP
jgi:hypothetical protein